MSLEIEHVLIHCQKAYCKLIFVQIFWRHEICRSPHWPMLWPQPIITTIITYWKWRASTACEAAKMEVVMVFYPLQLLGGWNFFKVLKRKTRPRCYRSELADPSWNCLPLLGYRTLCEHRHRSRCGKIAFISSSLRMRQTWRRWRPIRGSWDSSGKSYKLCETFCKRMHSQGGNSWGRRRVSYRNYWLMSKEGPWLMPFGRRPRISQETRFFFFAQANQPNSECTMIGSAVQHPPFLRSWQLMDTNPLPATINEWSPNFIRLVPCKVKQRHQKPQEIRPASWFPLFFFFGCGVPFLLQKGKGESLGPL